MNSYAAKAADSGRFLESWPRAVGVMTRSHGGVLTRIFRADASLRPGRSGTPLAPREFDIGSAQLSDRIVIGQDRDGLLVRIEVIGRHQDGGGPPAHSRATRPLPAHSPKYVRRAVSTAPAAGRRIRQARYCTTVAGPHADSSSIGISSAPR